MEIKDILDLSYQWFDGFFTLWALYITLTGAILAYIGTAVKGTSDTVIRFILLLSFLMFAYVNWSALDSVGKQREALSNMGALIINDNTCKEFLSQESLNSCKESIKTILNQGKPFKSWQLTSFHVSIDILVLFAIWFVPGELARLDFSKALSNSKLSKLDDGQEINWGSNDIEVSYIASKKEWKLSNDYSFEIFSAKRNIHS